MANVKKIIKNIIGDKPKDVDWVKKDNDKDGLMNGLDCEPDNAEEQGFIHKAANFVRGRGYQDDAYQARKAKEQEQERVQQQKDLKQEQKEYDQYLKKVQAQEAYERREEQAAKKNLGRVGYGVYKGYDTLRDLGQTTARGTKTAFKFKNTSDVYDYTKNPGYDLVKEQSERGGIVGAAGKVAKAGIDTGEGVIRAVPLGARRLQYSKELIRERPGVAGGQVLGELAMWQGAGTGLSRTIGSTGKYSRIAADTTRSKGVRSLAKAGELAGGTTRRVLTSKPVRFASEGYTGEVVDVGQAYLGQRREIGSALQQGNLKEAGVRLAAGYAVEKAGDKAVASGFKRGMPQTTVGGKQKPDVDKFISESGSDPRISRLFERVPEKENVAQKLSRYSGVEFKKVDTRVDPEILRGTKPLKGDTWKYGDYRVKGDTKTKGVRGEKGEKGEKDDKQERAERQERAEKLEKLQKGERMEKMTKSKIAEPFFVPPGQLPGQRRGFNQAQFLSGFTTTAKIKNLAESNRKAPKKKNDYSKKIANSFKTNGKMPSNKKLKGKIL